MRNGDSTLICSFYWVAWFWGRNDPTSLAGTPTLAPNRVVFWHFNQKKQKRGCEPGRLTSSTYFNIHFTPCILYIYIYLPILDSGAFDLYISSWRFQDFPSFPTDRRALARNFAHPLDLGTVNSAPKIFSPFLGAPNTAPKVEEMMKLEFLNWFVWTFRTKLSEIQLRFERYNCHSHM